MIVEEYPLQKRVVASGESTDGPVIKISDSRLKVDADLEMHSGGEGHKRAGIEASCAGLAKVTNGYPAACNKSHTANASKIERFSAYK